MTVDSIQNRVWDLSKVYQKALKNTWTPQRRDTSDRGVRYASSDSPGFKNDIAYVQITTTGNEADFGDLTTSPYGAAGCGSTTRGIRAAGFKGPSGGPSEEIDYITYSSLGNATDFGDNIKAGGTDGASNQTREVFGGGYQGPTPLNVTDYMNYITIASTGDAADFGDLVTATRGHMANFASPIRGFLSQRGTEVWQFASLGNARDWGDPDVEESFGYWGGSTGFSNNIKGFHGGGITPSITNSIHSISTIHAGDGVDFGNLTVGRKYLGGCSNFTRGIFIGGNSPSNSNVIDYITMASTGDATDFGDLTAVRAGSSAASDSRGGLKD